MGTANRRMFSNRIIGSTRFLKMPISSQALYFHLGMKADDDGVVEAYPVIRMVGCSEDDLRVLHSKGFVSILNEELVTYVMDWSEHNKIRGDRKIDSIYKDLLVQIFPEKAGDDAIDGQMTDKCLPNDGQMSDTCQTSDNQMTAQVRLGKDRIVKDNKNIGHQHDADALFEKLWKLYPCKKGKASVSNTQKRKILDVGEEQFVRCIQRYVHEHEELARSGGFCPEWKHGSSFFNKGYVDYLDENYTSEDANVDDSCSRNAEGWET